MVLSPVQIRAVFVGACLAALLAAQVVAEDAPADSISNLADGHATLNPVTRLAHPDLEESSGLQYWQGAWWSHNDSGHSPELFRSATLDFADAEKLAVPGATNIDWEELAIYDGDLLICDIGDNRRRRDTLTLYRVTYNDGELALAASYRIAYPPAEDGTPTRHDAEAAFSIGGAFYIVTKHRGEGFTGVYRWDALSEDGVNVGKLAGRLDIGERTMITAGDTDGEHVYLLSYTRIFVYPVDRLDGKPLSSTRIHANQCEALCVRDGRLIITNEQRDVYVINDYLKRGLKQALPPAVSVELPVATQAHEPDGKGEAWREDSFTLPLRGIGEGEDVRWKISGPWLMLAGNLRYDGAFSSSSERGNRRGSGFTMMFTTGDDDFLTGNETFLWFGDNGVTGLDVWRLDTRDLSLTPLTAAKAAGEVRAGWMRFEYALPLTDVFGEGKLPQSFRVNLWGFSLQGRHEPHLSGQSMFSQQNPYTWAKATLEQIQR
jgi:hypothetical protein